MSLDFSAWVDWVDNGTPDTSDDDPARSNLVDVTLLRKTCVDTGRSVLRCLKGHYFSSAKHPLWDHVVRTQVNRHTLTLIQEADQKADIIRSILASNP